MDDETISTFTSLTGATADQASTYLQFSDGNLEQAAQLWFETGGTLAADSAPSQSNPPPVPTNTRPTQSRSRGYVEDGDGIIHIPSDDDDDMDLDAGAPSAPSRGATEDDEAMARRLQEEMYGAGGRGDPEEVRAPISRTTETLVGPGSSAPWRGDDDLEAVVAQQMAARQARHMGRRPGIFNQQDAQSSVWVDHDADPSARTEGLARATGGASAQSRHARNLAEMFRPPFEIISRLTWEQAREEGKEEQKWLLVNVQDPSIFDCQVLNRDLWKDERVVGVIRESFLFLQYSRADSLNNGYMQYYFNATLDNEDAYPHIAIVDPRTGEQVKAWSGRPVPKPEEFVEALYNFLDRYSLDASKKNPVAKRKPDPPKKFDLDRMTEEEMMEMALQQSMANGGSGTPPKREDPDDLTKSTDFGRAAELAGSAGASQGDITPVVEESQESNGEHIDPNFAAIASDKPHTEPAVDASTTRIAFRHSGGRIIHIFALADPVRRIYEWLKAAPLVPGKEGVPFDLFLMGKSLIDSVDQTILEAGLRNSSINVEFLED